MISVEKYPNNTKTSNRRLNKSYHAGSEHTVRSKRSRRSYPGDQRLMPSAGSRRPRPSGIKMIELDLETRTIIRRIAFSTLIAAGKFFHIFYHMFTRKSCLIQKNSGAVCLICAIAKLRHIQEEKRRNAWIDKSEFWTDFFYNQFACSGVGIASIIVGLIFV